MRPGLHQKLFMNNCSFFFELFNLDPLFLLCSSCSPYVVTDNASSKITRCLAFDYSSSACVVLVKDKQGREDVHRVQEIKVVTNYQYLQNVTKITLGISEGMYLIMFLASLFFDSAKQELHSNLKRSDWLSSDHTRCLH